MKGEIQVRDGICDSVKLQEGMEEETQSRGEGTGLGEERNTTREGLELNGTKLGGPCDGCYFLHTGNEGHLLE